MATEYLTTDIDLKKVADGIRSRTGKTTPLAFPDGYVTEISTLTNTSDATATASDIASGKTAYVNGAKVTGELPDYFQIDVCSVDQRAIPYSTPDGAMVEGLCSVSGNIIINDATKARTYILIPGDATPDSVLEGATFSSSEGIEVTGTMPDNGDAAIQLSDLTAKPVTAGYYSGGTAKVADAEAAKIIPENIKKGVTILGVEGTMEAGGGGGSSAGYKVTLPATTKNWDRVSFFAVICANGTIVDGTTYSVIAGQTVEGVIALKCVNRNSYWNLKITLDTGAIASYNNVSMNEASMQLQIVNGPGVVLPPSWDATDCIWLPIADTTISAIEMYSSD